RELTSEEAGERGAPYACIRSSNPGRCSCRTEGAVRDNSCRRWRRLADSTLPQTPREKEPPLLLPHRAVQPLPKAKQRRHQASQQRWAPRFQCQPRCRLHRPLLRPRNRLRRRQQRRFSPPWLR
ncbi:unnamed protein product, partial [Scytosiphon promiscuus]